jgi:hypothetical protein
MIRLAASTVLLGLLLGLPPAAAQNGMPMQHMQQMAPPAASAMPQAPSGDGREFVRLPPPMQEHMLGNMRDHLATLNGMLGHIAEGRLDEAAKLAERRLGMSSLGFHDAAHMAPFMPQPMQDLGTSMHRAASRLAITLQDASVAPTPAAMADVTRGLHEVTTACTACHASFRIR